MKTDRSEEDVKQQRVFVDQIPRTMTAGILGVSQFSLQSDVTHHNPSMRYATPDSAPGGDTAQQYSHSSRVDKSSER